MNEVVRIGGLELLGLAASMVLFVVAAAFAALVARAVVVGLFDAFRSSATPAEPQENLVTRSERMKSQVRKMASDPELPVLVSPETFDELTDVVGDQSPPYFGEDDTSVDQAHFAGA